MKIEVNIVINGPIKLCITPEDEFEKTLLREFRGEVKIESPVNSNDMLVIINKKEEK